MQQKWGKTEQYLVKYPILAHFPKKNSKRDAKMGGKPGSTKSGFQHSK
jgi:hypothetical protein